MHEAALKLAGVRGSYLPFHVEAGDLELVLPALRLLGFRGVNVTVPHKQNVMPFMVRLSREAEKIGAVNTLVRNPEGWEGHNTDAPGFADAFLAGRTPSPALVLGAGGAARAVLQALLDNGFAPSISARRPEAAEKLAGEFSSEGGRIEALPWTSFKGPWKLVVNALSASSPTELGPDPPRPALEKGGLMADLNYGRPENHFKDLALASGAEFKDGLPMLASQARLSFILWTGLKDTPLDPFLTEALAR
jgi:shikimate dehydrogenase